MTQRKKKVSIEDQKKALKELILKTPIEEILPNKNRKAIEHLRKAGLIKPED